ncbi:TorD/DmsD family molecular chaperone [Syntrophomonas erecta]
MTQLTIDPNLLWAAREVFRYPEREIFLYYREDILSLIKWAGKYGQSGLEELEDLLRSKDPDCGPLKIDFTGLFINGFPAARAHPFAGWYLGDGEIFGSTDEKTRRFYSRYGITMEESQAELPADHIMVELEFLAAMAEDYIHTGFNQYLQALQEMMNQHLSTWIFTFLQTMHDEAHTDYYRKMAQVIMLLFYKLEEELKGVALVG